MSWEVSPEPGTPAERAALLKAVEEAVDDAVESAWWRSGLDDGEPLSGGPKPAWRGPELIEP